MRVLLAEDTQELSAALQYVLERSNYTVDTVETGTDALNYAFKNILQGGGQFLRIFCQ